LACNLQEEARHPEAFNAGIMSGVGILLEAGILLVVGIDQGLRKEGEQRLQVGILEVAAVLDNRLAFLQVGKKGMVSLQKAADLGNLGILLARAWDKAEEDIVDKSVLLRPRLQTFLQE